MSHLLTSKQECTRHVGICRIFRDLGGPGFSHNSFHSLNTLTSGNSSLYLTSRPPPAVNTHFRFLLSPVGMENSWPTSSVYSLSAIHRAGVPWLSPATTLHLQHQIRITFFFVFICGTCISVCTFYLYNHISSMKNVSKW